MKKLIIIILLAISYPVFGVRHYVKVGGGGAGTLASPFATVAQVNAHTFAADDTVSFYCGDLWREALVIPNSGTSGHYIVFNSYGTGARPKLYGSNISTSWADQGSNIWKSSSTFSLNPHSGGTFMSEIFFVSLTDSTSWGHYRANTGACTVEYDWTWSGNYIYVYSPTNPGTRYSQVEIPQRNYVVNVGDVNQYICLDGLDIKYAVSINVDDRDPSSSLSGFTIKNCIVAYVGNRYNYGTNASTGYNVGVLRNHLLIQNNIIHDGGRRNISIHAYENSGLTFSDFIIEGNTLYSGFHATGFGIAMDGPNNNCHFSDIIIRNNFIYDLKSRVPATDGCDVITQGHLEMSESGGSISNVQVYNNIFAYTSYMALELKGITGADVYNNTFYDVCGHANPAGLSNVELLWISSGSVASTDIIVKNNIFYISAPRASPYPNAVYVESGSIANITLNYNLFYSTDNTVNLVNLFGGSYLYNTSQWAAMKSYTGWQANGPAIANPNFVSTTNYNLQAGSPAIGVGTTPYTSTDKAGNNWANPPSLGAYEYNVSAPVSVTSITVTGTGGATTITTNGGTLQLIKKTLPVNANDTTSTWSISDGSGHGTIGSSGLVTAMSNGTVTTRATANDGSGVYGTLQLTFSNQATLTNPTVTTSEVTSFNAVSAVLAGEVTNAGNGTVSDRGLCWSSSVNPTISDSHIHIGSGLGSFSYTLRGLHGSQTIHIRAFATNENGTAYGSDIQVTTPAFSYVILQSKFGINIGGVKYIVR